MFKSVQIMRGATQLNNLSEEKNYHRSNGIKKKIRSAHTNFTFSQVVPIR